MAAKNKKKGGKQGWVSKGINAGLIALGFSRVIELIIFHRGGGFGEVAKEIKREATFGLSEGSFDLKAGLRMYTPAGAAAGLGALKTYLLKKYPVR